MNTFKTTITDPDFWLRLLYTVLFALAWQVVELLLAVILVLQIGFRLFTGQPHADLAGLGNSLSQYAWQIGRYLSGASEIKPWPFLEWPAADAQWQPAVPEEPVAVNPEQVSPAAAAAPVQPVVKPAPVVQDPLAEKPIDDAVPPTVEPDAPVLHPAASEPPIVEPDTGLDATDDPGSKPTP